MIIGWMRRGIVLGLKVDECPQCHDVGPNIILRLASWFCVFWIPVLPFSVSHKLVCAVCGNEDDLTFGQVRAALKTRTLRTGRARPAFMASLNDDPDMVDPEDWRAFGLEPGASTDQIKARWRELAKKTHPDVGGTNAAFTQIQGVYRRLLGSGGRKTGWGSEEVEAALEQVVVNPDPGGWNWYLKAWPFLAATFAAVILLANGSVTLPSVTLPVAVAGGGHDCYVDGDEIVGCRSEDSGNLAFGTDKGTAVRCTYDAPLQRSVNVPCEVSPKGRQFTGRRASDLAAATPSPRATMRPKSVPVGSPVAVPGNSAPTATPKPAPTTTPKPTPAPARLAVTKFSYQKLGCTAQYGYGGLFGLKRYLIVKISATIKNSGGRKSDPVWLLASGAGASRSPESVEYSAKGTRPDSFYPDADDVGAFADATPIAAGKSKKLSFFLYFSGTKPAKYDIDLVTGPATMTRFDLDRSLLGPSIESKAGLQSRAGSYCR